MLELTHRSYDFPQFLMTNLGTDPIIRLKWAEDTGGNRERLVGTVM